MGYESKFYIVEKYDDGCLDNGKRYASVIATMDMSKCYKLSDHYRNKNRATDCYFYDGDEEVLEDRYGAPITESTVEEAIRWVKESIAYYDSQGYHYWRLDVLLGLLESLGETSGALTVLHYGY